MRINFLSICCIAMLGIGCASTASKVQEQTSQGVYAVNDAISANRFDLAKQYSDQTIRLVPPPKKRIPIKGVSIKRLTSPPSKLPNTTSNHNQTPPSDSPQDQNYVVLPPGVDASNVIVVGSTQWSELLSKNTDLQKQVTAEQSKYGEYKQKTDSTLRDQADELAKLRAKPGFFRTIWNLIKGVFKWGPLGLILLAIGVGVACILAPEIIPVVLNILAIIWRILIATFRIGVRVIGALVKWLGSLFKKS